MNIDRDFEGVAAEWLDSGTDSTPPELIDAVVLAVRTTPQERDLRIPWRSPSIKNPLNLVAAIAVMAVAGVAAIYAFGPGLNVGALPTPRPTIQETQAPSPATVSPAPLAFNPDGSIDTRGWATYTSSQYELTLGHPASWTVRPAERTWELETDAGDWLSRAMDDFISPDGHVRVSAWAVAVEGEEQMWVDSLTEAWANVAAWVEDYCQATGESPCTGIHERAVPLCLERRDCHPGLLVAFDEDVQAFFTNGGPGTEMFVVVVWRPESDASVASYGGARRLLEGFLATMCVWPEDARPPFEEQIPGC